jgi:GNAT superfamily N-acetyltransferase
LVDAWVPRAEEVLGRAFFDDPLWTWVLPDDADRRRALGWFMGVGVRYGHAHGTVHAMGPSVEGCAVWLPPGDSDFLPERGVELGMNEAPEQLGEAAFLRFLTAMSHLEPFHHEQMPDDHWYLMILGVDPPRQRQGVGGALLQPVLARADEAGQRCYLETQRERNVPFYQAHGFEVAVETDIPDGGPHMWLMARSPRRS